MGMFDWVDYEDNCHKCGHPLEGFQSKNGDCAMALLKAVEVRHFYAARSKCEAWHDYTVLPKEIEIICEVQED